MPTLKILCTRKTASPEKHLRISHVGGANNSGMPWALTAQEAIRTIGLKQYTFVVVREGRRTEVQVAQAPSGEKFLRCAADGAGADTLLALPDCP
jgi:hypothetical protein